MAALVDCIAATPELFGRIDGEIRLALVARFPYYLPFRELDDKIEVLGVCHASRRPGYWEPRRE